MALDRILWYCTNLTRLAASGPHLERLFSCACPSSELRAEALPC